MSSSSAGWKRAMNAAVPAPDFEAYANDSLHVEATFAFADTCRDAMRSARGTFVDIGAGDGAVLRSALRQGLLDAFDRIVAIDVSPTRVRRICELAMTRVSASVGEAADLPFENGVVDFAFSHQVIEHVPSDAAMAAEIHRVLRRDGTAYVTSVVKRWYGWYFYRCNGKWRLDPTHVREYRSLEQYAAVFEAAGLRIEHKRTRELGHRIDKIVFRILERLRLVGRGRLRDILSDSPAMRFLSRFQIPVPGYVFVEVLVRKP